MDAAEKRALTPEHIAAAVSSGVDVNAQRWGDTALHWAVRNRDSDLTSALMAAGADANVKDKHGRTCVFWAAKCGPAALFAKLVGGGGSVNEPCKRGKAPLVSLVKHPSGDAAGRLAVLLRVPDLHVDVMYNGASAEEWALRSRHRDFAAAIAAEVSVLVE